jgi:hypothetical protein
LVCSRIGCLTRVLNALALPNWRELDELELLDCGAVNAWTVAAEPMPCDRESLRLADLWAAGLTIGIVIADNDATSSNKGLRGRFMIDLLL